MSKANIDEIMRWRDKCEALAGMFQQATMERDEARAEVERLRIETRDALNAMREQMAARSRAYKQGAEAMREACAMLVLTSNAVHGRVDADALRALPIPEEP